MRRRYLAMSLLAAVVMLVAPAAGTHRVRAAVPFASVDALKPVIDRMLGNPSRIRLDVVPDVYDGGYARISVYAQNAAVGGMRVDELWIRLVGASLDPAELRHGTLKVLGVRDSGVFGRVSLKDIAAFLTQQGGVRDLQLSVDHDLVVAAGTYTFQGVPTHARMTGLFQVYGEPEVRFHIESLAVNGLPVPSVFVDRLEHQLNPVVDFRSWPVPFKIRSFRAERGGFVLSSDRDFAQPCNDCGGPELRLTP
jgi:hypothetical protein